MNVLLRVWFLVSPAARSKSTGQPGPRAAAETPDMINVHRVIHTNGHNCPPFYVQKGHDFPVMWCPFCGAECRHTGEFVKEANR